MKQTRRFNYSPFFLLGLLLLFWGRGDVTGAPDKDLWSYWNSYQAASKAQISHQAWQTFLDQYLRTDHPDGIFRLDYTAAKSSGRERLQTYLKQLQQIPIRRFNRLEQQAFWINLYNAATVWVILEHYPVASIRDIDISPGWFSNGPWDAKILTVEHQTLSLNDVEHRILRPIWNDPRIHYVVNCASLGCPNLSAQAYTAANLEEQLTAAARAYINHSRGVTLQTPEQLRLSSIYDWYEEDFGETFAERLQHLQTYARPDLQKQLRRFRGDVSYDYDWRLNGDDGGRP